MEHVDDGGDAASRGAPARGASSSGVAAFTAAEVDVLSGFAGVDGSVSGIDARVGGETRDAAVGVLTSSLPVAGAVEVAISAVEEGIIEGGGSDEEE